MFCRYFAPNLTHKRGKVRVAVIDVIKKVMHCGAHESILDLTAFRRENLLFLLYDANIIINLYFCRHPNLVPIKAFYGDDIKVNMAVFPPCNKMGIILTNFVVM